MQNMLTLGDPTFSLVQDGLEGGICFRSLTDYFTLLWTVNVDCGSRFTLSPIIYDLYIDDNSF